MTPIKIRPDGDNPTAPTWKLEMGGRARDWAEVTSDGRSWVRVRDEDLAMDLASVASITKTGRSILGFL